MTTPPETRSARERVFDALKQGSATRPELAQRTGLSVVSVIAATDELIETGLVALDDTPPPTGRGRPAAKVRLRLDAHTITTIDLGTPEVIAGRYNLLGQRLFTDAPRAHGSPFTLYDQSPEKNVDRLYQWLADQGPAQLSVISVLGAVHPRTRRIHSYPLNLKDHPLEHELSQRLGWPVLVENDANLSAWQMWHTLKLSKDDPLVFLNFSAGIGLGMVLGGQIYYGSTGAAGEVSYAADPEKRGRHDILARKLLKHLHSVLPHSNTSQVAALAAEGNKAALRALKRFNQDLANHLTAVAAVLDPTVMVLQDLPHAAGPLLEEVRRALTDLDLPTKVIISPLGPYGGLDSAGAYGAAWLERVRLGLAEGPVTRPEPL
ncbi:ROK family transcriptional regulator [Deinococcus cellulosilyticus]|uniref:Sugar kinase n=1 Tax=Deinococcus cellulosilyticus (strain DSM 18568 / NBRC 106333 / KACC 11606 / 5516J-15) TaxID=1223518 RepID=A0A511N0A0_DEIC1|nr:ROK family transcriptional regulator [Deinococcus cellulosilyticus]GEM46263.1 sugar kinase [Deinococcus cellulosilyticus NBRC 106333 = KACC 11606]